MLTPAVAQPFYLFRFLLLTHCLSFCWRWLLHWHCATFLSHTKCLWCTSLCSAFSDHYTSSKVPPLSLRTSSLLSSSWIPSTLTWWRSLSARFLANFPFSFVTISIWRSLRKSAFLIYQGTSKMFHIILFWNRWMMSTSFCFVHPHSCMP